MCPELSFVIQLATSVDLRNFTYNPAIWLPLRADSFDSFLVEAGPMPLPLSDGNFLFLVCESPSFP